MQSSACTLEIRNLTKRYHGLVAVDDISFTIRPGEVLGYLGPNGSGNSTTVKMLIGLVDPSQRTILLNGASVLDDLPEYQRRIGYVPEESNLYPYLSGREFLQLAGRLRGLSRRILDERIEELLRLFSLWDDRDSAVSSYSKGMRQKVQLSAALIHNPDILILDEPLSGLDVNTMLVVPVFSILVAVLSQMVELFWCGVPLLAGVWLWLRRRRREGWGESKLMYEDVPSVVTDLGIREIRSTQAIARG